MSIRDNMIADKITDPKYNNGLFINEKAIKEDTDKWIDEFGVLCDDGNQLVGMLSGGNVQKVLVGREIASNPIVLMVAYPVRGLDINSSYTIYNLLNQQKKNGVAVLCVGEDLDVLLALCDRIMVIGSGRITGIVDGRTATKEEIGLLMTKSVHEEKEEQE
jgi:simple sugar transport system ATP-binding protein